MDTARALRKAVFGALFFAPTFLTGFLTVFFATTFLAGAFLALVDFFTMVAFFALVGMAHILPLCGPVRKIADTIMIVARPIRFGRSLERGGMIFIVMWKKRAHFRLMLLGLDLLLGCATAPPVPAQIDSQLPAERNLPATVAATAPTMVRMRDSGDAWSVNGADGLVNLCQTLRDEASVTFSGNAVEQARAADAHARQREDALAGRYVAVVPASGFAFRAYDLGERRLVLDTRRTIVVGDGAELFVSGGDSAPGFALGPDLADRILVQRAADKLALRVIFRPAGSELRKDACLWLGGGRVVKMEIELLAAALVALDGTVLARGDTGDYADSSVAVPVLSPKVTVHKPRAPDGKEIPPSVAEPLAPLAEQAQPCYEHALVARPNLRGMLVLSVRIVAGGRVESPHVEMTSLGDPALASCVVAGATKAKLVGVSTGQRFSVPLQFGSAEER
jgi:hypothetical protein